MRSLILSAIAGTALLGTTAIAPAKAAVSADINIHVGRRAPAVYFQREPRVMLIPDTEVYYVNDLDYDMYRCDGWWYIDDGGYWYRSHSYRGPWINLSISSLPRRVLNVPIAYRHQPYRSPSWDRGYNGGNRGYNDGNRGYNDGNRSGGSWSGDRRRQDDGRSWTGDRSRQDDGRSWTGDRSRQDDGRNSDQRWRDGRGNDQSRGGNNGRGNSNGNGNGHGRGKGQGQGNHRGHNDG
jgi:hypothetical protein